MSTIDYKEAKKSEDSKTFIEGYVKRVARNSLLVMNYPFLLPLDYQRKVPKDYDFTYTEIDMLPKGWHSIMCDMCVNLLGYFRDHNIDPYAFHIDQLKEKFGSIRLYYSLHLEDKFDDEGIDAKLVRQLAALRGCSHDGSVRDERQVVAEERTTHYDCRHQRYGGACLLRYTCRDGRQCHNGSYAGAYG